MCNYDIKQDEVLYKSLYQPYKNETISILQHNLNIINEKLMKQI